MPWLEYYTNLTIKTSRLPVASIFQKMALRRISKYYQTEIEKHFVRFTVAFVADQRNRPTNINKNITFKRIL